MKKKDLQSETVNNSVDEDDDYEFKYDFCPYCDNKLEKFDDLYTCTVCDSCFVVDDEGELVPAERYVDPNEFWD